MRTLIILALTTTIASSGLLLVAEPAWAAPDTLITMGADGNPAPGAAESWKIEGNTVIFTLLAGVDAAEVAEILAERLSAAEVTSTEKTITVSGVPPEALLEQLSSLSLSGEIDPLADLAGLGGTIVAMQAPEGGGSIRASNPAGMAFPPEKLDQHDPGERVVAEVLRVKRGTFPYVTLKLRIRTPAKAGPLKKNLRRGKVIVAPVLYGGDASGIDFHREHNQRNLVSYYLSKGDKVNIHPVGSTGGKIAIDWIERK